MFHVLLNYRFASAIRMSIFFSSKSDGAALSYRYRISSLSNHALYMRVYVIHTFTKRNIHRSVRMYFALRISLLNRGSRLAVVGTSRDGKKWTAPYFCERKRTGMSLLCCVLDGEILFFRGLWLWNFDDAGRKLNRTPCVATLYGVIPSAVSILPIFSNECLLARCPLGGYSHTPARNQILTPRPYLQDAGPQLNYDSYQPDVSRGDHLALLLHATHLTSYFIRALKAKRERDGDMNGNFGRSTGRGTGEERDKGKWAKIRDWRTHE